MRRIIYRQSLFWLCCLIAACIKAPEISEQLYTLEASQHLYAIDNWNFQGRLALHSDQDSWSANLHWQHQPELDRIKLSGPMGQGAVIIELRGDCMTIDQAEDGVEFSCDPDELIQRRVGIFVPVTDLSLWVLGLPGKDGEYQKIPGGFIQSGWRIRVRQSMRVQNELLPHKIVIANQNTKLKLVIDQWVLN